ncbi:formate--tetrahydrofolate ligase [Dysgonomonas sp. PFB1-18]|uniref:formate--tetrahydrofolate ligase n=1 Tax=unclassified Dysgonomonas TaxID=2630389 RepID=UPI002476B19E|nr:MULTISPECIES: formate--tetrahydrofolate ligase [unclassified Dysgonomonas]MDH6310407.1 formate--tetrahydrofolate ligase [Dysgonomonas sp. PF1-14]MDH6340263.1 formate--tetrahydrofolate ligase [Dysgonomonas sp. PF1-16]MDH6381956.1 formate--tetrahydrofolate ligase [Dysgonomonas sp. PFB1-18]MDH6399235.1 formate--tetrahydrofolate ligase [Dysgonomonas sp. PF1-23]
MKTDIEIARSIKLKNVSVIAENTDINPEYIHHYGKYIAKIPVSLIDADRISRSKLILVTAITPTKAGIGKTTTSIGLVLGLNKIGKKAIVALREPSLGPCFGMKGGAAGGGYAQVLPMEDINLHFTGDFHAITSAHNMITALLDNYLYRNRGTDKFLKEVVWKRVLDVNDRNLRYITTGLNGSENGTPSESGFEITPASEIMAILCLSKDLDDLKRRVGNIILGYAADRSAFTVNDLGVAGAITVLLKDAINPNLVQTTENTPAIIHGGPFANIAHGCNSIIATKMAMSHSDYVVTEAGFGADLGAEKFFDIKCRKAGIAPKLTIIVVTTQALKMHGNVPIEDIKKKNIEGLKNGFANMDKHIANMKSFGQNVLVALNKYGFDSDEEIDLIQNHCKSMGVGFALNESFANGGDGAIDFAKEVVKAIEQTPSEPLRFVYEDGDSTEQKIEKIAKQIYGADKVVLADKAKKKLPLIAKLGIGKYPVCIAKTQYSFSDNAHAYGTPKGFTLTINDIVINNGAEFIVAIAGSIMRMPGLPAEPQAKHIDIVDGVIEGLS